MSPLQTMSAEMNPTDPNLPPSIAKAVTAVAQAAEQVKDDPKRPAYHFMPPALWINDPNGTVYHDGWYHMFYQHNPYGDRWGHIHWGHARSKDMIRWEHLPIALAPAKDRGENHCWSGSVKVNKAGEPLMFYTSIDNADTDPIDKAQQWIAVGDKDLMTWQRPDDPVFLPESLHGDTKVYDWRDPYLFDHDGQTYMVLGGNLGRRRGGTGVVTMYRAKDESLKDWDYQGIVYRHPEFEVTQLDCPNLFPLDGKWVLLFSPWHGSIRYMVGEMDFENCQFIPEMTGLLDAGPDLFATNTINAPDGRTILWSWVRGYKQTKGWCGCLALPRELSIGKGGELIQKPARETESLRKGKGQSFTGKVSGSQILDRIVGSELEISCQIKLGDAQRAGLIVLCDENGEGGLEIYHDADGVHVGDTTFMMMRRGAGEEIDLQIHVDRTVIEVLIDGGRYSVTRVHENWAGCEHVLASTEDGEATFSVHSWELA